MVHCFTYETKDISYSGVEAGQEMSANDYIWETFDGLFKTVHRQGRRVEELEARILELERRLDETRKTTGDEQHRTNLSELPVERAA